ncbi:F0F1 ATP synthase subunit B' [Pseudoroseomonas wenyumeiae]|uniref:ATP synthase subunit b n=2 Tax=Teichococcus wenyumeiae TaxID=2478470 RepID=A0A3A9JCQ3_9PROT|nr:F0F1 ATP synthase subunit B' [Pseudoroseomonas wenyumeiae]RMI24862.1 F0F1 ATP synthase subunit B' [Pseudoroseomonas wenyumeiae]
MQMMKPVTLAGMMAALLVNVGAFAQPITDGALEARSTAAAEASGGMPQLDFSNPLMLAQVVWLLIIFGVLYYVLAHVVLPRFDSVLENRRARIQGDLEAARAAKADADAALEAHRVATARSRTEAQAAIAEALASAQADAAGKTAALNAKLNEQIAAAEARINAARDAAMGALREVATDTTDALVQRLTGLNEPAAVQAAVGRELAAQGRA